MLAQEKLMIISGGVFTMFILLHNTFFLFRREVYHIQRELLRERTRCKALEEELENPMNIHRWRKLEGSDPSAYEMIQKIQVDDDHPITIALDCYQHFLCM